MLLSTLLFLGGLGPMEITLMVVVILLLFGGKKIPELMRGIGKGVKEFKSGIKEDDEDNNKEIEENSKGKDSK